MAPWVLTRGGVFGIENVAMAPIRTNGLGVVVATLAIAGIIVSSAAPSRAEDADSVPAASTPSASAPEPAAAPQPVATQPAAPDAAASPAPKKTLGQKVKALVAKLTPERVKMDREFKKAAALFPEFCHHWEQNLHDRETNNLEKLNFTQKDGYETATYTGYGKVAACESHQSKDGYSIGKITYEEFLYYIVGKTKDEAAHAVPKKVGDTHTTEIFRWENNKWFY